MRSAPPNTHLPNSPAGCIEIRPDLDCSPVKQPQQDAQARAARGAEREVREAAQAARTAHMWTVCKVMNMTFLAARSAGCARTMDTGHRIVQRRGRRIERRGTENRRGEGG